MFLNKVHDQKVDLLRAVFRNMYLKEKCDYLDGECKMLAEHVVSSQVTKAETTEQKVTLENELNSLRQAHDQKMHELSLANEQLIAMSLVLEKSKSSILTSTYENKSINEELEAKNNKIISIQEELIDVRLRVAEKWALIRELRQTKGELEKDKEMLTKTKPETIARLQEELIQARLLETQFSIEFDKIRKQLQEMKHQINNPDKDAGGTKKEPKVEGKVKLSKLSVLWKSSDKTNVETIADIEEEIKILEREKSHLLSRIPDLQNRIEILNKHCQFKETERSRVQEKLDSTTLKYRSVENLILERKRQFDHLNNSGTEKVCLIRKSAEEKAEDIDELSRRVQTLANKRRQSYSSVFRKKELSTIQALEDEILFLEDKICQLHSETVKTYPKKIHNDTCVENGI